MEGRDLQRVVSGFETQLRATLEEIWARPIMNDGGSADNGSDKSGDAITEGWAARMAANERSAGINPLDKVEQNEISHAVKDWRIPLYEIS